MNAQIRHPLTSVFALGFLVFVLLVLTVSPSKATAGFFSSQKTAGSAAASGFLPVEEAFRLKAALNSTELTLSWQIQPEHYLYRSRFKVQAILPENAKLIPVSIPRGQAVYDEFQGNVEILRGQADLIYQFDLPQQALRDGAVVEITFQGCAEAGLCYPPHTQVIQLLPNSSSK